MKKEGDPRGMPKLTPEEATDAWDSLRRVAPAVNTSGVEIVKDLAIQGAEAAKNAIDKSGVVEKTREVIDAASDAIQGGINGLSITRWAQKKLKEVDSGEIDAEDIVGQGKEALGGVVKKLKGLLGHRR